MRIILLVFSLFLILGNQSSANAVWEFRSENKPSGITAVATTTWLENRGPVTFEELMTAKTKERAYWAILTMVCDKKNLSLGVILNISGSGNKEVELDDPGYTYLKFDKHPPTRVKTIGSIPSMKLFASPNKIIVPMLKKARYLSLTMKDVNARKTIQIRFDVSGISKSSNRFRSAGCKI
jgi:hypothetical protein